MPSRTTSGEIRAELQEVQKKQLQEKRCDLNLKQEALLQLSQATEGCTAPRKGCAGQEHGLVVLLGMQEVR